MLITRKRLLPALKMAASVAKGRDILSHVLLMASNGALSITASDDVLTMRSVLGDIMDDMRIAVPARELHDIVKGLTSDSVSLEAKDGGLTIIGGNGRYRLPAMPAKNFPRVFEPPAQDMATVPAEALARALHAVEHCAGDDTHNPAFAGLRLHLQGNTVGAIAATPPAQMVRHGVIVGPDLHVNARAVPEVLRLMEGQPAIEVGAHGGWTFFAVGNTWVASRNVGLPFPCVDEVMTAEQKRCKAGVDVRRVAALSVLERMVPSMILETAAGGKGAAARVYRWPTFTFGAEKLTIHWEDGTRMAHEEIPTGRVEGTDDPVTIAVNPHFVLDAVKACPAESVRFEFSGHGAPLFVSGGGTGCLIMTIKEDR